MTAKDAIGLRCLLRDGFTHRYSMKEMGEMHLNRTLPLSSKVLRLRSKQTHVILQTNAGHVILKRTMEEISNL